MATGVVNPSIATYLAGQCTAYVASTLSWVPGGLGDAKDWVRNAQNKGYQTSTTPVPGAVAVWGANMGGAFGAGHVAVVQGVQANGLPIVSEMNWTPGPYNVDTRKVTPGSASGIVGYILPPNVGGGYTLENISLPLGISVPAPGPDVSFGTGRLGLIPGVSVGGHSILGAAGDALGSLNPVNQATGAVIDFMKKAGLVFLGVLLIVGAFVLLMANDKNAATAAKIAEA